MLVSPVRPLATPVLLLVSMMLATACGADRDDAGHEVLHDVLSMEDARPADEAGRQALTEALASDDPLRRQLAARAMGRLEDPALVTEIAPLLADPEPAVRAAAAFGVAQSVHGADGTPALGVLLQAAGGEGDPVVRADLARALGRIRPGGTAPEGVASVLAGWVTDPALAPEVALGVALGLESLSRASGPASGEPVLYDALTTLAGHQAGDRGDTDLGVRTRAVAVLALGQRGRLTPTVLRAALEDSDPSVRAMAARYLRAEDEPRRMEGIVATLDDPEMIVRIEALRVLAATNRDEQVCRILLERARSDEATGVRLVAIEALGEACPEPAGVAIVAHLDSVAGALPSEAGDDWGPAAWALSALARRAPEQARARLPLHRSHPNPFVRAAAAEVAGTLSDRPTLDVLVGDPDPNVRTAALPPVFAMDPSGGLPLALDQLEGDDGQLLITAAALLEEEAHPATPGRVLAAFERISSSRRETARDPRMALLAVLRGTGDASLSARLEPYLTDYDAVVATEVAGILETWTGVPHQARPQPLPRLALPTVQQLGEMDRSLVVLHMARGGEVVIELFPTLAPTNAFRFFRLAGAGYFDGLTLHRWVPNFVIQGGSPAANEYTGDGPYTRDEIGTVSHWRGTVGTSTRGRDTGDGQIFVNLVHNVRLDHDYTVFGAVVTGMDVVDSLLGGDVIERAEIRPKD